MPCRARRKARSTTRRSMPRTGAAVIRAAPRAAREAMLKSPRSATIVGIGQTKQARRLPGRTSQDLVIEAVKGAIADAGLAPRDVDGAAIDWPGPGGAPRDAENWAMYLRQPLSWCVSHHLLTAGVRGVLEAAAAVEAGLCEVAGVGSGRAGPVSADRAPPGAHMS